MARQICDAIEAGQVEVLADERTRFVKASLPRDHELIYPPVQEFWDAAVTGTPEPPGAAPAGSPPSPEQVTEDSPGRAPGDSIVCCGVS